MNNIGFNDGTKEFAINGDESRVLKFNPTDVNLINKIKEELEQVVKYADDKKVGESAEELLKYSVEMDKEIRKHIDGIFYEGASKIIFEDQNVLSTVNGTTIFERFFTALLEIMKPYAQKEGQKSKEKIEKYKKQHDRITSENNNNKQ